MSEILKIFRIFENRQPEGLPQAMPLARTVELLLIQSRCLGLYVRHLPIAGFTYLVLTQTLY
ncbi:hypothetical protein T4B_2626 [Trichinella pseudospiralis]|uniref:Uncharacterized protein n=1 Tax=Trichinella pseudospiralis TaxID=6337 RepID=A0A0V1GLE3_TRIPS|nr:hypothetical protein T4B_2626 [Trichinella pseudospiralis]